MTEKTYQMAWDCAACGTEKLLGLDHRFCPNCGSPQDPETRYFPGDDDKVAVEDHEFAGADRECGACEVPNSARASHCGACGCPMDDAEEVARRKEQRAKSFEGEAVDAADDEHRERKRQEEMARRGISEEKPPPPEEESGGGGLGKGLIGCVVLALLGFAAFCAVTSLWKKEANFAVASHSWERSVEVEEYKSVDESAWCDAVPKGGEVTKTTEKERDTKQVPDGEDCTTVREDKGDGTFTEKEECKTTYRDEPIYDDWCNYEIDKWVVSDTKKKKGSKVDDEPAWPEVKVRTGKLREGKRTESYTVLLKDGEGESHSCDFPQKKWASMAVGSQWKGEVAVVTGGISCSSLVAQ